MILTKTDHAIPALLDRLRTSVCMLALEATVTAAVLGETVPLPPADPAAEPIAPIHPDADPVLAPVVEVSGVGWQLLSVWLSALIHARGHQIMRIKGAADSPAGSLLLQSVGRHMQPPKRVKQTSPPSSTAATPRTWALKPSPLRIARAVGWI